MTDTHGHFPAFKGKLTRLDGGETAPSPAQVHHPANLHQLLANHVAAPSWLPPPPAPDASPLNSPTATGNNRMLVEGEGGEDGLESVVPRPSGTGYCREAKALQGSYISYVRSGLQLSRWKGHSFRPLGLKKEQSTGAEGNSPEAQGI